MREPVRLPVVGETGSLRADGRRRFVHPADVRGRFTFARRVLFAVLILVYVALPFVHIGGHPALFLDVVSRKFYLFGFTFNAQDTWLAFFLVTGVGFLLLFLTAMLGRVWCGYACPQTVFLDGVYRRIERLLEGPAIERVRRNARPLRMSGVGRKLLKHILFLLVSTLLSHVLLAYFVSLPALFEMVRSAPSEHPEVFVCVVAITLLVYGNFAWFREQLCLIVCPYGRLQSVLMDDDSVVIAYDASRGEPRGKARDPKSGDCVDCGRCVAVCPTAIDIRDGLQLDCIGCAACVDACDEIMGRLGRDRGLVRYDSLNGITGRPRRFLRPRSFFYVALGLVGLVVAGFALESRSTFEANLIRLRAGAPFVQSGDQIQNGFELHLVNKENAVVTFEVAPASKRPGVRYVIARPKPTIESLRDARIPVFVTAARGAHVGPVRLRVRPVEGSSEEARVIAAPFLAPNGR